MAVSHIINSKSRELVTALPTDTVEQVAQKLARYKIGAVVVTDAQSAGILGIVSERDIVRGVSEKGAEALKGTAGDLMTRNVRTCKIGDTEAELMALMTQYRIRHLPVVEAGKLVGMISIGDVVKHRIGAIEREAEEMKAYISSAG